MSSRGYVRIPGVLRERHLTPDAELAFVQACGCFLLLTVPSERDNLQFRIEITDWMASELYERSITRGAVHVKRWKPHLVTEEAGGRTVVPAKATTIEIAPWWT